MPRFWPLRAGRIVTSPFGPRDGEFHAGTDFGFPGGSAGQTVYAIQSGTVIYAGAADGYGGGDKAGLAGWLVIDSDDGEGGGCLEYGHIVRLPFVTVGSRVVAGQAIAAINADQATNGGVDPHLHLSDMPVGYDPDTKQDPMPRLRGALDPPGTIKEKTVAKPDYNEYPIWAPNNSGRGGTKPSMFLLHTQEGPGNADSLARYFTEANPVSYHYTVSQAPDNGVTVVDCVDTDLASWSVLDYNARAINLCFAGSSASWSRAQWMAQSRAIDVAAYLAVQDCKKYGIAPIVVPPPYKGTPGISDHAYVTSKGIGTHTDVGQNFPWDYFAQRIDFWLAGGKTPAAPVTPPPVVVRPPVDRTDLEWLAFIGDQAAVAEVVRLAKAGDARAGLVLKQIERSNPTALQRFIDTAKGA